MLDVDCLVPAELMTVRNVDALAILEPCGNGCPKPVFAMEKLIVDRITMVGSGRHMRLRLRSGHTILNAIYFSASPESTSIVQGDLVDVAFNAQINDFRGDRTVQMNILDIRPSCPAECSPELHGYGSLRAGERVTSPALLTPDRATLADVWRYLAARGGTIQESPICLCRKIVRRSGRPLSLGKMLVCLDIFADVGLLRHQRMHKYIIIELNPATGGKADLNKSKTLQNLLRMKES